MKDPGLNEFWIHPGFREVPCLAQGRRARIKFEDAWFVAPIKPNHRKSGTWEVQNHQHMQYIMEIEWDNLEKTKRGRIDGLVTGLTTKAGISAELLLVPADRRPCDCC